jgi:hypothetical protein
VPDPAVGVHVRLGGRCCATRGSSSTTAPAPGWVEGVAALADPATYPPAAQRAALDATLTAFGL